MSNQNKPKIAWITDSTTSISDELKEKYNIHTIPLSVIFGDRVYKDGVEITADAFYKKLKQEKELPTSSQPTVGEFVEFYEALKEEYDLGISVHISSELSGTYQNAIHAAEMADFPLRAIDSQAGACAVFSLIESARQKESSARQR